MKERIVLLRDKAGYQQELHLIAVPELQRSACTGCRLVHKACGDIIGECPVEDRTIYIESHELSQYTAWRITGDVPDERLL